ncbi:hypothetical protein Tco_1576164 [Tanacetum coccineum]
MFPQTLIYNIIQNYPHKPKNPVIEPQRKTNKGGGSWKGKETTSYRIGRGRWENEVMEKRRLKYPFGITQRRNLDSRRAWIEPLAGTGNSGKDHRDGLIKQTIRAPSYSTGSSLVTAIGDDTSEDNKLFDGTSYYGLGNKAAEEGEAPSRLVFVVLKDSLKSAEGCRPKRYGKMQKVRPSEEPFIWCKYRPDVEKHLLNPLLQKVSSPCWDDIDHSSSHVFGINKVTYTSSIPILARGGPFWPADEEMSDVKVPPRGFIVYGYDVDLSHSPARPHLTGLTYQAREQQAHDIRVGLMCLALGARARHCSLPDSYQDRVPRSSTWPPSDEDCSLWLDADSDPEEDPRREEEASEEEDMPEEEERSFGSGPILMVHPLRTIVPFRRRKVDKHRLRPTDVLRLYTSMSVRTHCLDIYPDRGHLIILLPPVWRIVERLLALPYKPTPSPLISLSPPLQRNAYPSSSLAAMGRLRASSPLPPPVPAALPLPPLPSPPLPPLLSSPLPPLPNSLFIPLVDRREDIPEAKLPPRKRLCLTTPASRYEVGESLTAVPRPTGGHSVDYGFVSTLDAEARRQRAEAVGYRIRDTWVDPRETTEEVAPVTLEGVNTRDRQTQIYQTVETLVDDSRYHYETAQLLDQEALVSREAWALSMGFSSADSLIAALTAQVSSLQGHLAMALGEIRALQAREQARADAPEGTGSSS